MDNSEIKLVGAPCGHHGPYTFYKAFKYAKGGQCRVIGLCEFFFVKLWSDSDLVCIGELQLLWADKNSDQMLASLRLYFLPENTPEGRIDHGEDEVLAISEKVVLRLEDLLTWITVDTEWSWGRCGVHEKPYSTSDTETPVPSEGETDSKAIKPSSTLIDSTLDFSDIEKERKVIDDEESSGKSLPSVVVLSYPRYCRYRSIMKRLEGVEGKWLKSQVIRALGGFSCSFKNTRVLFCKDTFDYPDLEGHELLCNHLAPKLKGRPRGKRKKRSTSPGGSESNESESSYRETANVKTRLTTGRNGLRPPRRSTRSENLSEEREFMNKLNTFMRTHKTPIGRIPSIGYKEIDLYQFFTKVQKLGGYDSVTANRMWKPLFDELGGHQGSTSAATIMRRHYERLLLAYERHVKGEEYKPLPVSERRRLKTKTNSFSDAEMSETDRSSSGHTTPIPSSYVPTPSTSTTPSTPTENKEFTMPEKSKSEGKTSSLRSVRVKPDRTREIPKEKLKIRDIPHTITSSMSSIPDKNPTPVTSAVAPVVEKVPEKSVSPLEGKENVPLIPTEIVQAKLDDDVIEVPYKPPTPEVIDLDSENEDSGTLYDVKKRKLDILKEGGLEVTAVATDKDRPTVIQPPVPVPPFKHEIGNLSITVSSDMKRMPPPQSQVPKKSYSITPIPDRKIRIAPPPKSIHQNGQSPPKVVQSESIYSYSQRTWYGNPKDPFMPPPVVPRNYKTPPKDEGVLDLTVNHKSPQKPISSQKPQVEIMRVPNITSMSSRLVQMPPKPKVPLPVIEGRLGSNLEITLVSSKNQKPFPSPKQVYNNRPAHKRSSNGKFVYDKPRVEANGRNFERKPNINVPMNRPEKETVPTNPYLSSNLFHNYLSQLPKNLQNPSFLPILDPIYYSALCSQGLYPPSPLANVPPLFPQASSVDQYQFFKDFMTHGPRGRFPFNIPQDGSMTITSVGQNNDSNIKK